jgi:small subunit ribosomal protein S7e
LLLVFVAWSDSSLSFLDSKDANNLEHKLDSFSSVYNKLTGKSVVFQFEQVHE